MKKEDVMSNKKESEKNNNINSYRYLAGSGREIRSQHTRNLYSLLTESPYRNTNSATNLYSNINFSEEFGSIADEMPQTLKSFLNSIVLSHDDFGSMFESIPDIKEECLQTIDEIDLASIFDARFKRIKAFSFDKFRDIVEDTYNLNSSSIITRNRCKR